MPEVVHYVAASLDGYIATRDGGVEWLAPFEGTGEDCGATFGLDPARSRVYKERAGFSKPR